MKKTDDIDFMGDLDAIRHREPRLSGILFLYAVLALVICLGAWSVMAQIDEITQGTGVVAPMADSQNIQSLEGGILEELLIKEGDIVKKGQVLMRLRDVTFASEERGTQSKLFSLQARKARLTAEANGTDFTLSEELVQKIPSIAENEKQLYLSRKEEYQNALKMIDHRVASSASQIQELRSRINSNRQEIALIEKELAITSKMVAMKAAPQIEEIKLRRELNDVQGDIKSAQERINGLNAELAGAKKEAKDQADKFRSQALGELNATETELSGLKENLKSIGDRVDRAEIRSPVDGIVNNIALKTLGGVVEPAMKLAEIVPADEDLKIVAKISPNDIAFLKIGQPARVQITAYDSARYGHLAGQLVRISANSITDYDGKVYFEIEVQTDKNHLGTEDNPLPITSGMIADVRVITGKKTMLEYLLKPFLRLKDQAFSER